MAVRLSRMETLPDEALPILQWVYDAILSRRMTQLAMREELNARLEALQLSPISSSGFSRFVLRVRAGEVRRPQSLRPGPQS